MKLGISRESLALFLICLADAVLTITFVAAGKATEANPLMARCLAHGYAFFFIAKMSTVVVAVIAAELYRRHNPVFIKRVMQTAITAYIGIYFTLFLAANSA